MGRTLLLVAMGLASVVAALAPLDAQANLTPGVSATWRTVDSSLVGIEELPYSRLIHSVFELRGDTGGEKAYLSVSWHERRFSTKKAASCGGLRYVGRYVIDSPGNAGDAWFGLEDRDGTAHLTVDRMLPSTRRRTSSARPSASRRPAPGPAQRVSSAATKAHSGSTTTER